MNKFFLMRESILCLLFLVCAVSVANTNKKAIAVADDADVITADVKACILLASLADDEKVVREDNTLPLSDVEVIYQQKEHSIMFGGVRVCDVEKKDIRFDENSRAIFCVWFKNGAYAEYTKQKEEPQTAYCAIDKKTGSIYPIPKKVYEKNQTVKDGKEYEFKAYTDPTPYIFIERNEGTNGTFYDIEHIVGVNNLLFVGSPNSDRINILNSNNANIVVNNDDKHDVVNIGVDCKGVKASEKTPGLDEVSIFSGFLKDDGYMGKYKIK